MLAGPDYYGGPGYYGGRGKGEFTTRLEPHKQKFQTFIQASDESTIEAADLEEAAGLEEAMVQATVQGKPESFFTNSNKIFNISSLLVDFTDFTDDWVSMPYRINNLLNETKTFDFYLCFENCWEICW